MPLERHRTIPSMNPYNKTMTKPNNPFGNPAKK